MITFLPLLALPLCLAILILCIAAILPALLVRARGAVWRLAGFALLLLILSGPTHVVQTHRSLPDIVTVALDQSQSMSIGNRNAMAARALQSLQAQAATLPNLQLRVVDIPPAADNGTSLFATLRDAMSDTPEAQRAGTILITDGEISDAPASASGPPLTALLTGKGEETDRELRLLNAPGYGLVGKTVSLTFTVIDHGADDDGAEIPVTIDANGAPIWSQTVPEGAPISVDIPVRHAGPATISVQAAALPGEVSAINDQAAFTLNGVRKTLEVLLVSGNPNQGERSWRVLLKSDPAVQLVHFTILRTPGEIMDALPDELALVPFPVEELFSTDIGKFDLIILDQFNASGLLPGQYLQNIADHVREGGALLVEVGPEFAGDGSLAFTPLGPLLPAVPTAPGTVIQAFTPTITPLGTRHPVTAPFAGAPLAPWYRQEIATQTSGDVLLSGIENAPLLIVTSAGQGRVGLLLSDQFWLWNRAGPPGRAASGPALPLLRRAVHWLLDEPSLEAEALNAQIDNGQLIVRRQTLSPNNPGPATITAPDGSKTTLSLRQTAPGMYSANLPAGQPGVWQVAQGSLITDTAQPVQNALEYQDLAATATRLRGAASSIIWLGQNPSPALGPLLRLRHATEITGQRDVPLLPPFPSMILVLLALGAAWWRERG
jgi:hypothetical protein